MSLRSFYMHQDKKRTKGSSLMRGLGAALLMMLPALVFAQDAPPPPNKGDISWLMTSTVLVILMTIPGLRAVLRRHGPQQERAVAAHAGDDHLLPGRRCCSPSTATASRSREGSNAFFGGFSKLFLKGMTGDSLTGTFSKATQHP